MPSNLPQSVLWITTILLATPVGAAEPHWHGASRTTTTIGTSADTRQWNVSRTGSTLVFRRGERNPISGETIAKPATRLPKDLSHTRRVRSIDGYSSFTSFAWDVLFRQ